MDHVRTPTTDQIVDDKYRLHEQLGEGGSAIVFRATQTMLGTQLAIKLIKQTFVEEAGLRLKTEAQILAQLQHKNIVRLFHCGVTGHNEPYMAFEFAEGISLRTRLQNDPKLTPDEIVDIVSQALDGLIYAHNLGFVHRDLKPENMMLCDVEGQRVVKLLDFGLAKILPNAQLKAQHETQTGMVVGSPLYMSPEQCISSDVDARSDIYSMGCVLFEMLAGHPPFYSDSATGIIIQHHSAPVPTLALSVDASNKEKGLAAIATNCLQKDPVHRYQSAAKMQSALGDLARADLIPQSTAQRVFDLQKIYLAGVGLALVTAGILFWQSGATRQSDPQMSSMSGDDFSKRKDRLDTIFTEARNSTAEPQVILAHLEKWRAENPQPKIPISAYSVNQIRLERLRLVNLDLARDQSLRSNKLDAAHDYAQRMLDQVMFLASNEFVDDITCHAVLNMVPELTYSEQSQSLEKALEKLSKCAILHQEDDVTRQSISLELANIYLDPSRITKLRIAKAKQLLANQLKQVVRDGNKPLHRSVKQLFDLLTAEDAAQYIRSTKSITRNTVIQAVKIAKRLKLEGHVKQQIELLIALSQATIDSDSKDESAHYHQECMHHLVEAINSELNKANLRYSKEGQSTIDEAIHTLSALRQSFSQGPPPSIAGRFDIDNTLVFAYQLKGGYHDPTLLGRAKDVTAEGFRLTKTTDPETAVRYNQRSAELLINGNNTNEALATLRAAEGLVPKASMDTVIGRCDYYRELGLAFCAKNEDQSAAQCLDYCLQPDKLRMYITRNSPYANERLILLARKTFELAPTNRHIKEQVKTLEKAIGSAK